MLAGQPVGTAPTDASLLAALPTQPAERTFVVVPVSPASNRYGEQTMHVGIEASENQPAHFVAYLRKSYADWRSLYRGEDFLAACAEASASLVADASAFTEACEELRRRLAEAVAAQLSTTR